MSNDQTFDPSRPAVSEGATKRRTLAVGAVIGAVLLIAGLIGAMLVLATGTSSRSAGSNQAAGFNAATPGAPQAGDAEGAGTPDDPTGPTGPTEVIMEPASADAPAPSGSGVPTGGATSAPAPGRGTSNGSTAADPGSPSGPTTSTPPTTARRQPVNPQDPPKPPAAKPVIRGFSGPAEVDCLTNPSATQSVLLRWGSGGAVKAVISIDGPGAFDSYEANGQASLPYPCSGPHTYRLTVYGADGQTATKTLTINSRHRNG